MNIKFLGHASFLLTTSAGTRIITDPFDPNAYPGALKYARINEKADVVTVSHDHADHHASNLIAGGPMIIKGSGKFVADGVDIFGVPTYHDDEHGAQRGKNTIFVLSADGLRVAHFGDLGHVLTGDQAAEVGSVDVALIPVGGFYTIDAKQAAKVAEQVSARVVIPMHYSNEKCSFPIASVEGFIAGKPNVVRSGESAVDVNPGELPAERTIIVLEPSL
ncbi:MAG: MBL fold metallo-hydrolase [Armatimonadota bacterium]|jgi:L-ascorbate metabolism protein UlaG (beta-lactamase superfamily)